MAFSLDIVIGRKVIRAAVLLLTTLAAPALAQVGDNRDLMVRDRTGKVVERLEPQRGETWTRRGAGGRYEGTAEVDRSGRVILRAPGGRVEGTVEPAPGYRSRGSTAKR